MCSLCSALLFSIKDIDLLVLHFFKKKVHGHGGHGGKGIMGTALGAGVAGAALSGHLNPVSFCMY
jgi:hypothetical protein